MEELTVATSAGKLRGKCPSFYREKRAEWDGKNTSPIPTFTYDVMKIFSQLGKRRTSGCRSRFVSRRATRVHARGWLNTCYTSFRLVKAHGCRNSWALPAHLHVKLLRCKRSLRSIYCRHMRWFPIQLDMKQYFHHYQWCVVMTLP